MLVKNPYCSTLISVGSCFLLYMLAICVCWRYAAVFGSIVVCSFWEDPVHVVVFFICVDVLGTVHVVVFFICVDVLGSISYVVLEQVTQWSRWRWCNKHWNMWEVIGDKSVYLTFCVCVCVCLVGIKKWPQEYTEWKSLKKYYLCQFYLK